MKDTITSEAPSTTSTHRPQYFKYSRAQIANLPKKRARLHRLMKRIKFVQEKPASRRREIKLNTLRLELANRLKYLMK